MFYRQKATNRVSDSVRGMTQLAKPMKSKTSLRTRNRIRLRNPCLATRGRKKQGRREMFNEIGQEMHQVREQAGGGVEVVSVTK